MRTRLKQSITPFAAVLALCAVVVGTRAASGEEGRPGARAARTSIATGVGSVEHKDMIDSLPVRGIDPEAAPPSVDDLWRAYADAARCLEREGFQMLGPVAGSDGARLLYLVYSPPGGPVLAPSNVCEDPLKTGAAAFERAAPTEARARLVDEFRATMACLGLEVAPLEPHAPHAGRSSRDLASEELVMRTIMRAGPDDQHCTGQSG